MPDRVDGQQDVLHGVLDVAWVAMPAHRQRTQVGSDFPKEALIGQPVAVLGMGHQDRPVGVADRGLGAGRRDIAFAADEPELRWPAVSLAHGRPPPETTRGRQNEAARWSSESLPGPSAMMATASAAQ